MKTTLEKIQEFAKGNLLAEYFAISTLSAQLETRFRDINSHIAGQPESVQIEGKKRNDELRAEILPLMTRFCELSQMDEIQTAMADIHERVADIMEAEPDPY